MRGYRKPYRIKRKKSILRSRFFWLGILSLIVFGATLYFLFISETFQIKKVVVTGQEKVSARDIEFLIPKKNIFLVNAEDIKENVLGQFPQIAQIEIHRSWPDTLNVIIGERRALAVWCEDEKCFFVDGEGVVFEEAPPETDLIKILGQKHLLEKERTSRILETQRKLKENLEIGLTEASLVSEKRLDVETIEGWNIYFDLEGDLDWQIQELALVLEKQIPPEKRGELEYIDLRFSRVYYRYR